MNLQTIIDRALSDLDRVSNELEGQQSDAEASRNRLRTRMFAVCDFYGTKDDDSPDYWAWAGLFVECKEPLLEWWIDLHLRKLVQEHDHSANTLVYAAFILATQGKQSEIVGILKRIANKPNFRSRLLAACEELCGRTEANVSQAAFARLIDKNPQDVSNWIKSSKLLKTDHGIRWPEIDEQYDFLKKHRKKIDSSSDSAQSESKRMKAKS